MLASRGATKVKAQMLLRILGFVIALAIILSGPVRAEDAERMPYVGVGDAQTAIARALGAVHKMKCAGAPCQRATTEEFADPPLDLADARFALLTGAKSARLKWCGLDWTQRAFPLMLQEFQQRGIHNARTLALIVLIHNEQFGRDYANLQALKTCSETFRATLDAQIPAFEPPPWQRTLNNVLLDQSVAAMLKRVLSEIHKSRCGDNFCEPATDDEKANPPITVETARQAMQVGLMSGVAKFCAIDWQRRIFYPFMAYQRRAQKMSIRQLAIVAMLHGTMQGFMFENYQKHEKACTDKMRSSIEKQFLKG
jgi:hypothetical protein